ALHARGLPPHQGARPRSPALGERPAHGGTSKVRRSAGGVSALRGGDGAGRALSAGARLRRRLLLDLGDLAVPIARQAVAVDRQLVLELPDLLPALGL